MSHPLSVRFRSSAVLSRLKTEAAALKLSTSALAEELIEVDDARLAVRADDELLRAATDDQRALVTENVKDFARIVRTWATAGEQHAGVVFTSPRSFHRGRLGYPEDLVVALRRFLSEPPREDVDWVHWLSDCPRRVYPVTSAPSGPEDQRMQKRLRRRRCDRASTQWRR